MSDNEDDLHADVLKVLLKTHNRYIVVKTKFTINHIERTTYRDRGRWKWIAETNVDYWGNGKQPEKEGSHIDGGDLFPRLYFNDDCFIKEFFTWLKIRNLKITDITVPKI